MREIYSFKPKRKYVERVEDTDDSDEYYEEDVDSDDDPDDDKDNAPSSNSSGDSDNDFASAGVVSHSDESESIASEEDDFMTEEEANDLLNVTLNFDFGNVNQYSPNRNYTVNLPTVAEIASPTDAERVQVTNRNLTLYQMVKRVEIFTAKTCLSQIGDHGKYHCVRCGKRCKLTGIKNHMLSCIKKSELMNYNLVFRF